MYILNFIAGASVYCLGKLCAYIIDKWWCSNDTTDREETTIELNNIEKIGLLINSDSDSDNDSIIGENPLPPSVLNYNKTHQSQIESFEENIKKEKVSDIGSASSYFFRKREDQLLHKNIDQMLEPYSSDDEIMDN